MGYIPDYKRGYDQGLKDGRFEVASLKAEVEVLDKANTILDEMNDQKDEEVERLQVENEGLTEKLERNARWNETKIEIIQRKDDLLGECEKKLEIYREHSDGEYHGGTEHSHLIEKLKADRDNS